jgi:hypothetical protein
MADFNARRDIKQGIESLSSGPRATDRAGTSTGSDKHIRERVLEVKETPFFLIDRLDSRC